MKKVLLSLAVAAFLVSCGGAETTEKSALDTLNEVANAAKTAADSVVANAEKIEEAAKTAVAVVDSVVASDSVETTPADTTAPAEEAPAAE